MYLYEVFDWTRIHQYLKRLYLGTQTGRGRGDIKFSVLFKGETENFKKQLREEQMFFDICFQSQEPPPTPNLVAVNDTPFIFPEIEKLIAQNSNSIRIS